MGEAHSRQTDSANIMQFIFTIKSDRTLAVF